MSHELGNGQYNNLHDARMDRDRQMQRREEFLAGLTPEELLQHNERRRIFLRELQRQTRILIGTIFHRRHIDNVISDENERENETNFSRRT